MYTVVATWFVLPDKRAEAITALNALAEDVQEKEPDTWGYLVHSAAAAGSLPPASSDTIVFVEIYKDKEAFLAHVNGPVFQGFLKANKDLFVAMPPDGPSFYEVTHLDRIQGFVRPQAS
jgi:quinol monooxygenase YgiN